MRRPGFWFVYWLGFLHALGLTLTFVVGFAVGFTFDLVAFLPIAMVADLAGLHLAEERWRRG